MSTLKAIPALPGIACLAWSCLGNPWASVSLDAEQHRVLHHLESLAAVPYNSAICYSKLMSRRAEPRASVLQLLPGADSVSGTSPRVPCGVCCRTLSRPNPAGLGWDPGRDPGSSRCCRDGFSSCRRPHTLHLPGPPGPLPDQSDGWGT